MNRLSAWFDRLLRRQPLDAHRAVRIDNRHLYLLPTRLGWLYGVLLLLLLVGSLNYDNNPGYLLTFLLAALGINAIFLTWRNLAGLELRLLPAAPVFAGESARVGLQLRGAGRPAVVVQWGEQAMIQNIDSDPVRIGLEIPTRHRGWLRIGEVIVSTRHPLGLLQSWVVVRIDTPILVYPRPVAAGAVRSLPVSGTETHQSSAGDEEWQGLRDFRSGDPLSHVDWKSLARERGLMTKQFRDPVDRRPLRLDWDDHAPADAEQRLQFLCHGVLQAARTDLPWVLRLPGRELGPDNGRAHRERCLKALALYGQVPEDPSG